MDKGKIYEIVWDNACFDCDGSLCRTFDSAKADDLENKEKFISMQNCNMEKPSACGKDENCDPKFYITWFGSDKNNRQLKSAGLAMSKFKQYSLGPLINSVKDIYKKVVE